MRIMVIGPVASMLMCVGAWAQTAEFKCPKPGTVVEFGDGARATWLSQEGNICKRQLRNKEGEEFPNNWYAPTLSLPADRSQDFATQVKPSTLWPLSVGKKITGRFDGVGTSPGFGAGTWLETITVDSYEKITTKAGTFDAFVVSRNEEALSHRYKSTARDWYVPALGVVVKSTFTDNQGANRIFESVAVR
jgi:hypothetical protein